MARNPKSWMEWFWVLQRMLAYWAYYGNTWRESLIFALEDLHTNSNDSKGSTKQ